MSWILGPEQELLSDDTSRRRWIEALVEKQSGVWQNGEDDTRAEEGCKA